MPLKLYFADGSPPSRAVYMVCTAAGVEVEIRKVNLLDGEHYKDWFTKVNPRHCVPVLDDDGFYLAESRTIFRYVMDAHAKDHTLYPKDLKIRAKIDEAMDYDFGLNRIIANYLMSLNGSGLLTAHKDLCQALTELDTTSPLAEKKYITGFDYMTIGDICHVATLSWLEMMEFDFSPFPQVAAFMEKMKAEQFYIHCCAGYEHFKQFIKSEDFQKRKEAHFERVKAREAAQPIKGLPSNTQ